MDNPIDCFIASLWAHNDQLSVYNPQIKTIFDTYSWRQSVKAVTVADKTDIIKRYKADLLTSLENDDTFPVSYLGSPAGDLEIQTAISYDARNMFKWLGGPNGAQAKVDFLKPYERTYDRIITEITKPLKLPLGSRDPTKPDDIGFMGATFVDMVQENFTIGNRTVDRIKPIFGDDIRDDYVHYCSTYFWFMYGILPRNGITYKSLREGLTAEGPGDRAIKDTIKFLGLVFNIRAPEVKISIYDAAEHTNKMVGPYSFFNVEKELPRKIDNDAPLEIEADGSHVKRKREENDKGKTDGKTIDTSTMEEEKKNLKKKFDDAKDALKNSADERDKEIHKSLTGNWEKDLETLKDKKGQKAQTAYKTLKDLLEIDKKIKEKKSLAGSQPQQGKKSKTKNKGSRGG